MSYAPVHDHGLGIHPALSESQPQENVSWGQQDYREVTPETRFLATPAGQKPLAEPQPQDTNTYWVYPHDGTPYAPSHQRGWSGSTISTERLNDKNAPMITSTFPLKNKRPSYFSRRRCGGGSWTLEIVTMAIAIGAVGSMMGVLARFNGQALPEWPYYITLNALIALLATITTASMSVSVNNGLSQLKWIRFKGSPAPLADMEVFDEASRGTWGALGLLASVRGGFLGSFGAIIAIVALALGPFAQQVVTYQTRTVSSLEGASVNRALNYTGALPGNTSPTGFVPILPLKSAVYSGLFAENERPGAALAFECQSGNCTWDPYETLGVCYECHSLTDYMSEYCTTEDNGVDDGAGCGWQVPQDARLTNSLKVFSMTSYVPLARGDMPHATMVRLIFMGTEAPDGRPGETNPWARECTLSACLQTLETTVENGVLRENLTDSRLNNTVVDIRGRGDGNYDDGRDLGVYFTGSSELDNTTTPTQYLLGIEAMLSMRGWFSTLFANGSATRSAADFNRTVADNPVVVNLTVGISSGVTFFDSDIVTAFYWNHYQYADTGTGGGLPGIDRLMSDVATSMTVAFRGFLGAEPVAGRAASSQSYVHVRWGFAALPIVVVAAAAMFLALVAGLAGRAGTRPWKGSALAMLFHGLDEDARALFDATSTLRERKRLAKDVKVQLDESEGKGALLRA